MPPGDRVPSRSGATRLTADLRGQESWWPAWGWCLAGAWQCGAARVGPSCWPQPLVFIFLSLGTWGEVSQRPHHRLRDVCRDVLAAAPQGWICISLGNLQGTGYLLGIKNQQSAEALNLSGKCDPSASRSWTGPVSRAGPGVALHGCGRGRGDAGQTCLEGQGQTGGDARAAGLGRGVPPCPQASAAAPGSPCLRTTGSFCK